MDLVDTLEFTFHPRGTETTGTKKGNKFEILYLSEEMQWLRHQSDAAFRALSRLSGPSLEPAQRMVVGERSPKYLNDVEIGHARFGKVETFPKFSQNPQYDNSNFC